ASIKYQEDAGVDIVTDGEVRRDNFYSFVTEKLSGIKLMKLSELMDYVKDRAGFEEILRASDVPSFAIKSPIAIDKVTERGDAGISLDEFDFLKSHTTRQTKIPLPGAYLLTRSAWFEGLSDKAYPTREDLAKDVVQILRKEVLALKKRGCDFIQFDEPSLTQVVYGDEVEQTFMCAALGTRRDPSEELDFAVRLMNETVAGIDGVRFGVHICRGNWSRKEDVLLKGNYGPLLPSLMRMNIHQLVLEMATPRAGEIEVFKEFKNQKELGLGVANPRTDNIEDPQAIVQRVRKSRPDGDMAKAEVELNGLRPAKIREILDSMRDNRDVLKAVTGPWKSRVVWQKGFKAKAYMRQHAVQMDEPEGLDAQDSAA